MHIRPLKTERLLLRSFEAKDIDAIFRIFSDREANTFLPWFPVETREEAEKIYREQYACAGAAARSCAYAVCLREDGIPIGYVHAGLAEPHDFGYALRREFWHRGIASEAGSAVIEQLRGSGLPYLTATHDWNNPRSGQVMRRLGMRYCYSYEEQWQPKNFPVIFRLYQLNFTCPDNFVYEGYWRASKRHFRESIPASGAHT